MANKKSKMEGVLVAAGCLIGVGLGLLYGRPDVGVLVGLGVGFVAMFIAYSIKKK